jgi:hypothetical protein
VASSARFSEESSTEKLWAVTKAKNKREEDIDDETRLIIKIKLSYVLEGLNKRGWSQMVLNRLDLAIEDVKREFKVPTNKFAREKNQETLKEHRYLQFDYTIV